MKRFAAGVVAAATALSLSTGVASAASSSGDAADANTVVNIASMIDAGVKNGVSAPHDASSNTAKVSDGSARAFFDFYGSSYRNDYDRGYAAGTTADIIWGVGIAAAALGAAYTAVQNGLVPGVSLPF